MPLDALCLSGVAAEIRKAAVGAKIDKIYQPTRDEVILLLRGPAGNVKLLLSANPGQPRAHLTGLHRENPAEPPMFCRLLRKYLTGARILCVDQPPLERLLDFRVESLDELGDRTERHLVLEMMGRSANLILVDSEGRITDCLRRVDADMSRKRQVLPGMFYCAPPRTDRVNPFTLSSEELRSSLSNPLAKEPDRILLDRFMGLSPLIAREISFRGNGESELMARELEKLSAKIASEDLAPYLLIRKGKAVDYSFQPILQYGPETECKREESFSAMLDRFYEDREAVERIRQQGQDLVKTVTRARDRTARKIQNQEKELEGTRDRDRKRQLGDILTTNLYAMQRGMHSFRAADYYDPNGTVVEIPLNPLLSPEQNAAAYYKAYNKAKTAEQMLTVQLSKGREELKYLNSVLESISLAEGERDLQEIRQELIDTGFLHQRSKARGKGKRVSGKPMEFQSSSGLRISVGKNNSQNDLLTTKIAGKNNIWLHTQKIHGSHVILWTEGEIPDQQSLTEAAQLAAWYSQGREGRKIPVDYTPVRYVKKPGGARPGMVIYTTYQTIVVDPDGDLTKQLRVR